MHSIISLLGVAVMLGIAFCFSENRRKLDYRTIGLGLGLQFAFGAFLLGSAPGRMAFEWLNRAVVKIIQFSNAGSAMVFGEKFMDHFFAFSVLPSIIFLSSIMAMLFYLGVMQRLVGGMAWIMKRALKISGAEAMDASANVFVGGVESAFTIRPYLATLTRSEMMTIITAGMSTIACGVLAAYAGLGIDAGHLLAAQVMSAIGAVVISKIMIPETEIPKTRDTVKIEIKRTEVNVLDAACSGAVDGLKIAAIVGALLIVFVALTAMINFGLGELPFIAGAPISVERILGWVFTPVVFFTGAEWKDCGALGALLGKKVFLNEFLAYLDLKGLREQISPRSFALATYFLCGFGNFSVVAMNIGGFGSLMPERRQEIAKLGMKTLLGGILTSLLSACIAGILMS